MPVDGGRPALSRLPPWAGFLRGIVAPLAMRAAIDAFVLPVLLCGLVAARLAANAVVYFDFPGPAALLTAASGRAELAPATAATGLDDYAVTVAVWTRRNHRFSTFPLVSNPHALHGAMSPALRRPFIPSRVAQSRHTGTSRGDKARSSAFGLPGCGWRA